MREAASRGGYSRALALTVCAFERDESAFYAGVLARKMDGHAATCLSLPAARPYKAPLSSYASDSVDFIPAKSLASRQLGASMDLDPGAARRLREALDILASGELPECPVCKPPRA